MINGKLVAVDPGLPQEAIDRGIYTTTGWQTYAQQQIADKQIAAQKEIAGQQTDFNQQQLQAIKDLQDKQQQAIDEQALRQSTYNQGQTQSLTDASKRISDAFAAFSPEYFNQYANDYVSQVNDQLGYQRTQANRDLLFGLARHGLSDSQQLANATGLLDETQGRTLADETNKAQSAAADLRSKAAQAKQGLLGQVEQVQAVGPPIATSSLGDVNTALDTQNQKLSGIASNAGDVVASLKGVPTVSTLGNIFSGVLGGLGSYLGGAQAQQALNAFRVGNAGTSGTNPSSTKSTTLSG